MVRNFATLTSIFSLLLFTHCGFLGSGKVKNATNTQTQSGGGGNKDTETTRIEGGTPRFTVTFAIPVSKNSCWPALVNYFEGERATPIPENTRMRLSGSSGVLFHSLGTCTPANQITELDFPAGSTSVPFFFKASNEGTQSVTVSPITGTLAAAGQISFVVQAGTNTALPTTLRILGPSQGDVDTCLTYTMSLFDTNGNPTSFTSTSTLGFNSGGVAGKFYTTGCGSEITSITVPPGTGSTTVSFKSMTTPAHPSGLGLVTLTATQGSLTGNLSLIVGPGVPHHLTLVGPTTVNSNTCVAYTLSIVDSAGNYTSFTTPKTATVGPGSLGSLFLGEPCDPMAPSVTTINIPARTPIVSFHFKSGPTELGDTTLTASLTGISPATPLVVHLVDPNPTEPYRLTLVTPTPPLNSSQLRTTAGDCFGPFSIELRNRAGAVLPNPPVRVIDLSDTGSGLFYSGPCTSEKLISSTDSDKEFYFRDRVAETSLFSAEDRLHQIGPDSRIIDITAGAATRISLIPATSTFVAGGNTAVTVRFTDAFGNKVAAGSAVNVALPQTGTPQGIFRPAGCTGTLPIVAGNAELGFGPTESEKNFCYSATRSGQAFITASAASFAPSDLTLNITAGAPTKIRLISGPSTVNPGQCAGPYRFDLFDANDNATSAPAAGVTATITKDLGNFYPTPNDTTSPCANPSTNTIPFPSGSGTQNVYFSHSAVGTATVSVGGTGLTPAPFSIGIVNPSPTKLALNGVAVLNANSPGSGLVRTCFGLTVKTFSGSDQPLPVTAPTTVSFVTTTPAAPTVPLTSADSGLKYFSESNCTGEITSLGFAVGDQSKNVYFMGTKSRILELKAQAPSLSSAQYQMDFSAGPAASIRVTGPAASSSRTCTGPFQVSFYDLDSNPTSGRNITVSFVGKVTTTQQVSGSFYRDQCVTLASPQTTPAPYDGISFYYKDMSAGARTLTFTASPGAGSRELALALSCTEDNNNEVITIGIGTANPNINATINANIAAKHLSFTPLRTSSYIPLIRSTGASGGGNRWTADGTILTAELGRACTALGYRSYVSSTCLDGERSWRYPNGKCNFHSPGDNQMQRFTATNGIQVEGASPKYNKTWVQSLTCRGRLLCQ